MGDLESNNSTPPPPECPICLEECVHPVELPCRHIFCFLCIKGVIIQEDPGSRICCICRAPIPTSVLTNPQLKDVSQLHREGQSSDRNQWYYQGGSGGWWKYEGRTSEELEQAFTSNQPSCQMLIAGKMYVIDFTLMIQYQQDDRSKSRRIRRGVNLNTKGVAGILTNGSGNASNNNNNASGLNASSVVPPPPNPDAISASSTNSSQNSRYYSEPDDDDDESLEEDYHSEYSDSEISFEGEKEEVVVSSEDNSDDQVDEESDEEENSDEELIKDDDEEEEESDTDTDKEEVGATVNRMTTRSSKTDTQNSQSRGSASKNGNVKKRKYCGNPSNTESGNRHRVYKRKK